MKTNINSYRVNLQNKNIKVLTKFYVYLLQNFLKYRILFKDIVTFLGLDYRNALLVILYLIVIGISSPKIRSIGKVKKFNHI